MAKILRLKNRSTPVLSRRKAALLKEIVSPRNAIRASYVRQFLTCGKSNCRCRHGHKHGPFHYLVQCLHTGKVRKFLLKTPAQRERARESVESYVKFQKQLEELSQINAELLRRGVL